MPPPRILGITHEGAVLIIDQPVGSHHRVAYLHHGRARTIQLSRRTVATKHGKFGIFVPAEWNSNDMDHYLGSYPILMNILGVISQPHRLGATSGAYLMHKQGSILGPFR